MEGQQTKVQETEEREMHEGTIDMKETADAFVEECIEVCEEVDGKAELETVLGMAWNIFSLCESWREDSDDGDGFLLRVGAAIGSRLGGK
ncbi:MAG: hypothetical protein LUO89_06370 [Methanothrix sp.]|nr:hypothetical protein [Methanothrix sp.]